MMGACPTLVHSLDGHPLVIKQLKGEEPVEVIDLSSKRLGVASAVVIASRAADSIRCDAKQTTEMALVIATPDDTTNVAESDGRLLHGRSPRLSAQKLANAKPITIAACWE